MKEYMLWLLTQSRFEAHNVKFKVLYKPWKKIQATSKITHNKDESTVMWTTLDPCLVLSESDSKLYTKFESVKTKFIYV